MAMTLSRLMMKSATMIVLMAPKSFEEPSTSPGFSSSGNRSFTPIQSNKIAPAAFKNGRSRSSTAQVMRMTRRTMAPVVPQKTPFIRRSFGKLRQASAITTALSPPSNISIITICATAPQCIFTSTSQTAANTFSLPFALKNAPVVEGGGIVIPA